MNKGNKNKAAIYVENLKEQVKNAMDSISIYKSYIHDAKFAQCYCLVIQFYLGHFITDLDNVREENIHID